MLLCVVLFSLILLFSKLKSFSVFLSSDFIVELFSFFDVFFSILSLLINNLWFKKFLVFVLFWFSLNWNKIFLISLFEVLLLVLYWCKFFLFEFCFFFDEDKFFSKLSLVFIIKGKNICFLAFIFILFVISLFVFPSYSFIILFCLFLSIVLTSIFLLFCFFLSIKLIIFLFLIVSLLWCSLYFFESWLALLTLLLLLKLLI